MIDSVKAKFLIVIGVLLLVLWMGKYYFPDLKNYLGFIWLTVLASILLFPIYCHKNTKLPCMMKNDQLDEVKNDYVRIERRILLEKYVSIFSFLVVMVMAVMYLVYA